MGCWHQGAVATAVPRAAPQSGARGLVTTSPGPTTIAGRWWTWTMWESGNGMTSIQRKCPLTMRKQIPAVWPVRLGGRYPQQSPANSWGTFKTRLCKLLETVQHAAAQHRQGHSWLVGCWRSAEISMGLRLLFHLRFLPCQRLSALLSCHVICFITQRGQLNSFYSNNIFCDANAMTFIHEKQSTNGESRVERCQKCDVNIYKVMAVLLQSHFPPGKNQSNRHCKHSRDPIWYFVKLVAYT